MTLVQAAGGVEHLAAVAEFAENGELTPVIDRRYPFDDIAAAIEYQKTGHASGKVTVTL